MTLSSQRPFPSAKPSFRSATRPYSAGILWSPAKPIKPIPPKGGDGKPRVLASSEMNTPISTGILTALMACLLLSSACARLTLEQLEEEAQMTGDWSKVEKRKDWMKRRQTEDQSYCAPDEALMCRGSGRLNRTCECKKRSSPQINL